MVDGLPSRARTSILVQASVYYSFVQTAYLQTEDNTMAVRNLFSKRKAARLGQVPEVQSEVLPAKFRGQVAHILMNTIGPWFEERQHLPFGHSLRPSN